MTFSLPEAAFSLTVPEAARQLGLHRNFLYKLIREGKVPHYRYTDYSIRVDIREIKAVFHREKTASVPAEQPVEAGS